MIQNRNNIFWTRGRHIVDIVQGNIVKASNNTLDEFGEDGLKLILRPNHALNYGRLKCSYKVIAIEPKYQVGRLFAKKIVDGKFFVADYDNIGAPLFTMTSAAQADTIVLSESLPLINEAMLSFVEYVAIKLEQRRVQLQELHRAYDNQRVNPGVVPPLKLVPAAGMRRPLGPPVQRIAKMYAGILR